MSVYFRPIVQTDPVRPAGALPVAGGWCWFDRVERIGRGGKPEIVPMSEVPDQVLDRLSAARAPMLGLDLNAAPRIMGILNVTPDSFSDGGRFDSADAALTQAHAIAAAGADILDIGGESTRPGADAVSHSDEIARTAPVIAAFRDSGGTLPVSLDTRKADVARTGLQAGAGMINDVAAFTYDPALAGVVAEAEVPVCLMHAQGDPKTMQAAPRYDDVLLDVYDFLDARVSASESAGIARSRIIVDPGIGFGKTVEHNLTLLNRIGLFHALGCPILLGASRKRFIGTISGAAQPDTRVPGSIAVALAAISQGVQILRVHDIAQTWQAMQLYMAVIQGRQLA